MKTMKVLGAVALASVVMLLGGMAYDCSCGVCSTSVEGGASVVSVDVVGDVE